MRKIVELYDIHSASGQHPDQTHKRFIHNTSSEGISEEKEPMNLQDCLQNKIAEIQQIKNDFMQLKIEKDLVDSKCAELERQLFLDNNHINNLNDSISELTQENDSLKARCMPASKIPAMIYYGTGDSTGKTIRKISTEKSSQILYKLITHPGNTSKANFYPIKNDNLVEVISNRNIMLGACEIISIDSNANDIETIEYGRAIFSDNQWIITSKAKIKLITV
ncbi:MAG: hypothetical protein K2M31_03380 [Muribaculaceae bacterium]|nr:hypothetical protein [Muribaculaceae bacterium]